MSGPKIIAQNRDQGPTNDLTNCFAGYVMRVTRRAKNMNKNKWMAIAGAAVGLVLLTLVVLWRVSASQAEERAAELVSSTADLVRCMSGDKVKLERVQVHLGFERRMVSDLPDISSAGRCLLALEVVTEKWDAYDSVIFNSTGARGDDGVPYGEKFKKAYDELKALPLKKSSDQVFLRGKKYGAVLGAADLAFEMYDASRGMYKDEGANEEELNKASETRLRKAPKVPSKAVVGRMAFSIDGTLKPRDWELSPHGKTGLTVTAKSGTGQMTVAWSDDKGKTWKTAALPKAFETKDAELRAFNAPDGQRRFLVATGSKNETQVYIGKVVEGKELPKPVNVPGAPEDWRRAPGGEREAVVLANNVIAFPVWRIVEKTKEEKKDEKEEREQWEENYADKAVQELLVLAEQRRKTRASLGIDDDHKRLDGIAYVEGGQVSALELPDYGLAGLIPGKQPMALLGEKTLPAQRLGVVAIPLPGELLGTMATASFAKPILPALRTTPWLRCVSSDGTTWGTTNSGNFLIGMRPDSLSLIPMIALADEGSHMGCGLHAATVSLPFKKDRIFSNLLTARGGEVEGAKIATTAGSDRKTYNATSSSTVVPGATILAWVARGYAMYTVNLKTDNDFKAPEFLAEAGADGSKITSVKMSELGTRAIAMVGRELCAKEGPCKTNIEIVVSDDAARTWLAPH